MSIALAWSEFKTYCAEVGPGRGRPGLFGPHLIDRLAHVGHIVMWKRSRMCRAWPAFLATARR